MISVLGSINLDQIATGKSLPLPGQTVFADTFVTAPGGKGANQALAAARAGARVKMVGAVGRDEFAEPALLLLKDSSMDLSAIRRLDASTGLALILVDGRGENEIVIVPGANGQVGPQMARQCIRAMAPGDILSMVLEVPAPALEAALLAARAKGVRTVLNIAPATPRTPQLAALADYVVANESEFSSLAGAGEPEPDWQEKASRWAQEHNNTLIVTLGAKGAKAFIQNRIVSVCASKITPVDTVGAGDTFCGYLAAGLDRDLPLEQAMQQAAVAGSLACLSPGAQPAIPFADKVLAAVPR